MNNDNREINADGIWEISVEEVMENCESLCLIDVRMPEEFSGELGHIKGSKLSTLQFELPQYLDEISPDEEYIFVCRSGNRSSKAAVLAKEKGFTKVYNMKGGMIEWNKKSLPIEK